MSERKETLEETLLAAHQISEQVNVSTPFSQSSSISAASSSSSSATSSASAAAASPIVDPAMTSGFPGIFTTPDLGELITTFLSLRSVSHVLQLSTLFRNKVRSSDFQESLRDNWELTGLQKAHIRTPRVIKEIRNGLTVFDAMGRVANNVLKPPAFGKPPNQTIINRWDCYLRLIRTGLNPKDLPFENANWLCRYHVPAFEQGRELSEIGGLSPGAIDILLLRPDVRREDVSDIYLYSPDTETQERFQCYLELLKLGLHPKELEWSYANWLTRDTVQVLEKAGLSFPEPGYHLKEHWLKEKHVEFCRKGQLFQRIRGLSIEAVELLDLRPDLEVADVANIAIDMYTKETKERWQCYVELIKSGLHPKQLSFESTHRWLCHDHITAFKQGRTIEEINKLTPRQVRVLNIRPDIRREDVTYENPNYIPTCWRENDDTAERFNCYLRLIQLGLHPTEIDLETAAWLNQEAVQVLQNAGLKSLDVDPKIRPTIQRHWLCKESLELCQQIGDFSKIRGLYPEQIKIWLLRPELTRVDVGNIFRYSEKDYSFHAEEKKERFECYMALLKLGLHPKSINASQLNHLCRYHVLAYELGYPPAEIFPLHLYELDGLLLRGPHRKVRSAFIDKNPANVSPCSIFNKQEVQTKKSEIKLSFPNQTKQFKFIVRGESGWTGDRNIGFVAEDIRNGVIVCFSDNHGNQSLIYLGIRNNFDFLKTYAHRMQDKFKVSIVNNGNKSQAQFYDIVCGEVEAALKNYMCEIRPLTVSTNTLLLIEGQILACTAEDLREFYQGKWQVPGRLYGQRHIADVRVGFGPLSLELRRNMRQLETIIEIDKVPPKEVYNKFWRMHPLAPHTQMLIDNVYRNSHFIRNAGRCFFLEQVTMGILTLDQVDYLSLTFVEEKLITLAREYIEKTKASPAIPASASSAAAPAFTPLNAALRRRASGSGAAAPQIQAPEHSASRAIAI